jgi:predicted RNA-binding protein YlqC (UPF0109 family)
MDFPRCTTLCGCQKANFKMKDLLEFLISKIIGSEDFSIEQEDEQDRVVLKVKVPDNQAGLVIGKEGKTIKNLRKILSIKAVKLNKAVYIKVNEE